MRKLTIEAQHNDIHILDGKDILFEDIHFKLPAGEIMVNVEGERSGNIVSRTSMPIRKRLSIKGISHEDRNKVTKYRSDLERK